VEIDLAISLMMAESRLALATVTAPAAPLTQVIGAGVFCAEDANIARAFTTD